MAEETVREFTFEEPPARSYGKYDWKVVAEKCKSQPGQWMKVFDDDVHSLVGSIRQGNVRVLHPDRGFVCRTANNYWPPGGGPRRCAFYIKYQPSNERGRQ